MLRRCYLTKDSMSKKEKKPKVDKKKSLSVKTLETPFDEDFQKIVLDFEDDDIFVYAGDFSPCDAAACSCGSDSWDVQNGDIAAGPYSNG